MKWTSWDTIILSGAQRRDSVCRYYSEYWMEKLDAVPHLLRNGVCWDNGVDVSLGPSMSESKALVHWSNNPNHKVIPFHSYGGAHLRHWALLHHSGRVVLPIRKIKKAFCAFGMIHPYPVSDKTCNKT
jgi:hypothetical protein